MNQLLNRALLTGSTISALGHDPYMAYNFAVEVGGVVIGGFSEVSGLSSEINLESYQEGGVNGFVHQFPKNTTYPNLVFTRGLVNVDLFFIWYKATSEGIIEQKNGTIILLNSQRIPVLWWTFKKAYPVKWEGPTFNASGDEIAIERIELVHQGITKKR
ncbi:phage tail protein [Dolichospermum sp. FACHB-1091]|uniref:phage tail protein n=1 Tax=Dolichospermum sp. FACHB-1091 TaxID=2692798 RepID=UPI00322095DA